MTRADMGVDLRRRDAGVPQEFLDHPEVRAVGQQVRREAVAERVGCGAVSHHPAEAISSHHRACFTASVSATQSVSW